MSDERILKVVGDPRMIRIAWDHFQPIVEQEKSRIIESIAATHSTGRVEVEQYAGAMGGYNALKQLENRVKQMLVSLSKGDGK